MARGGSSSHAERAAFIVSSTSPHSTELVPEIRLRLAAETTSLWHATESWLETRGVAPPFWAFAWSGGQALARYVLDNPEVVRGRRVVDFGTGGGIVAIAAGLAGAETVLAVDRDPLALTACVLNADDNGVTQLAVLAADDLADVGPCDVLLVGDVFYDRAEGPSITQALLQRARRGERALVGCPGRVATPAAGRVIASYDVPGVLELEGKPSQRTRVLSLNDRVVAQGMCD